MKIITKATYQMVDGGLVLLNEESYEYSGPLALCGGGPSDQEKKAAQSQLDLSKQLGNIASGNQAQQQQIFNTIKPFGTSRMNNGLPFANALSDYSAGTNARAFAPARAHLEQYLNKSPGGPSGYKAQVLGDFEANRARGFDQAQTGNLFSNEQAKQQGAQILSGQASQLNPLGYFQATQQGFNPQQYSGMRSPGLAGAIGGIAGSAISAIPF
jgi:hypothetical protein